MGNELRDSTSSLLSCFFFECEKGFRFLELKHGFSYLSGLVRYTSGRQVIVPFRDQKVNGHFWAVTRYEKDDIALEILYGDTQLVIESYLYPDRIQRLALSEILFAAKKSNKNIMSESGIIGEAQMQDTISKISQTIQQHEEIILNPDPRIVERTLNMRSKLLEQNIRAQYERDLQTVCMHAARAFRNRDYKTVVFLCTPYERDLPAADLKKLHLARQKLLKG